jgi:CBS domain-containing protein
MNLRDVTIGHLDITAAVCVDRAAPLAAVVEAIRGQGSGCALVCEGDRVLGTFGERELRQKVVGLGVDYDDAVGNHMSPAPPLVGPGDLLGDVVLKMQEGGHEAVAVTGEGGRPAGLLTAKDIIRYVAELFPREVLDLPREGQRTFDSPEGA